LRSVCTVALHQHLAILGGPGKKIEVGVISLGTTTQDGQHRQVKVEVLGVLDPEGKIVRLRAVEPLSDGERNYKKRFAKILEPLNSWVHRESIILTDLTVDKGTLHSMGYKTIVQVGGLIRFMGDRGLLLLFFQISGCTNRHD
jgi:pogo transposable element with ZNF domain